MTETTMIKPEDVKRLRDQTGAGIMDCKRALEESKGDVEQATLWLRAGENQPDLEPPPGAGTDRAELLRATQAHVGLLRRQLDIVAEASSLFDHLVMKWAQHHLRTRDRLARPAAPRA